MYNSGCISAKMMMMMKKSSNSVRFYLQEMFNTFSKDLKYYNSFFLFEIVSCSYLFANNLATPLCLARSVILPDF